MDICVNEWSLHNQFKDYDQFAENAIKIVFPCLEFAYKNNYSFWISEDLSERKVYEDKTFNELFLQKGDIVVYKIKQYILKFLGSSNYWSLEPKSDVSASYTCPFEEPTPNSLTEAAERDRVVFSFPMSCYNQNTYSILKNGTEISVYNFVELKEFYDILFQDNKINAYEFLCLNSYKQFELHGSRIKEYFNNSKRITYKEVKIILEDINNMIADINNSVKGSRYFRDLQVHRTRFWEFKTTLYFGEFRMFFIHHENKIVFFDVAEKHEQQQRIDVAPTTISNLELD